MTKEEKEARRMKIELIHGDCLEEMKNIEDNSIDLVLTDPPYGLEFMGKDWDKGVPGVHFWVEMLRVLKPGGYLLSFSGTRTYHRMGTAIEDAGFEVRDMIEWVYGSGFPKSLNIGKAVDKLQGNEKFREKEIEFVKWLKSNLDCYWCSGLGVISDNEEGFGDPSSCLDCGGKGKYTMEDVDEWLGTKAQAFHFFAESDSNRQIPNTETYTILKSRLHLDDRYDDFVKKHSLLLEEIREVQGYEKSIKNWDKKYNKAILNKPKTELASEWEGWGTALKPAHEPICMARKPLAEKTVVENCLKYGTGGINIDESRVGTEDKLSIHKGNLFAGNSGIDTKENFETSGQSLGRFPANLIHDNSEEVRECFPETNPSKKRIVKKDETLNKQNTVFETSGYKERFEGGVDDNGGNASRFFKSIKQDLHCSLCYDIIDTYQLTKNICNNTNVNNVEKSSETTQAITESTALKNATGKVNENLVQNVKSAGNLCDLCGTSIAQRLVAIMQDQSQESTLGELSMPEHKRQILEKCLVSFVELMGNTDTIPTMENLNLLFGYVLNAIEEYTQKCGDTKSEDKNQWKSLIYKSKASKSERNKWCEGLEEKEYTMSSTPKRQFIDGVQQAVDFTTKPLSNKNNHPTVKPVALMEYLAQMCSTEGAVVLDPFMGSGTTGVACKKLNRNFIGIELDKEYFEIAKKRIG